MNISKFFLERPVTTIVFNFILILLGVINFAKIDLKETPNIDSPIVNIYVAYQGASPEIMESEVASIVENSLWGIDGIKSVTSYNEYEESQISVEFRDKIDINRAIDNVRDKVSIIRKKLPSSVDYLRVERSNINDKPIIYGVLFSKNTDFSELSRIAEHDIKPILQNIDAVAEVNIHGSRPKEIRIIPNLNKIAHFKINLAEIEKIIKKQNIDLPLGKIMTGNRDFLLYSDNSFRSKEEIENIVIKSEGNFLLKLKDLAEIVEQPKSKESFATFNNMNGIFLTIKKKTGGNPIKISDRIKEILPKINKNLPENVKFEIGYDSTKVIRSSIKNIYYTICEAIISVCIIILFFLRQNSAVFIPLITIPICLIGNFTLMYYLGFSINIFTLLALILAVGLVVDDAIVMMENIYKHIENGVDPYEAALNGSKEVNFVIISITIILLAVFLPIGFMNNIIGKVFLEFAWTLGLTVLLSGIVAISLTPLMSAAILRNKNSHSKISEKFGRIYDKIFIFYQEILESSMKNKKKVMSLAILISFAGILLFLNLEKKILPLSDKNTIMVQFETAKGTSFERKKENILKMQEELESVKDIKAYLMTSYNSNEGDFVINLKDLGERSSDIRKIQKEITKKLKKISDVKIFSWILPAISISKISLKANNNFYLQSDTDYQKLLELAEIMVDKLNKHGGFHDVGHELDNDTPKMEIEVLKDQASLYKVNPADILTQIQFITQKKNVGLYNYNDRLYDIYLEIDKENLDNLDFIKNSFIRNDSNKMICLNDLIRIKKLTGPDYLTRRNKIRAVLIYLSSDIYNSEKIMKIVDNFRKEINENYEIKIDYSGELGEFRDMMKEIYFTFFLSILFVYLVLAAQFENFKDPFIILISVPFALTGALITLKITGNNINIYSQIGIITLLGLITKNSIMIVEFLNQEIKTRQKSLYEATKKAAEQRFRPIIMTSLAAISGALPMAFKTGYGSESLNNIGWVIVGGLTIGTLFTIIIIPIICLYFKSAND